MVRSILLDDNKIEIMAFTSSFTPTYREMLCFSQEVPDTRHAVMQN